MKNSYHQMLYSEVRNVYGGNVQNVGLIGKKAWYIEPQWEMDVQSVIAKDCVSQYAV